MASAGEPVEIATAWALLMMKAGSDQLIPLNQPLGLETLLNIQDMTKIKNETNNNRVYNDWAALMLADAYCSKRLVYIVDAREFENLTAMCNIFLNAWANISVLKTGEKNTRVGRGEYGLNTRCLGKEGLCKTSKIASKTIYTISHRLTHEVSCVDDFDQFNNEEYQMSLRRTIQNVIDENIPIDETNLTSFSKYFAIYLQNDMTTQISNEFRNRKRAGGGNNDPLHGEDGYSHGQTTLKKTTYQSIVWHEFNQKGVQNSQHNLSLAIRYNNWREWF